MMKSTLLALSCLSLLCLAASPRPRAPGAAASLTIRDATGLTVTLTPPLTITSAETVPVPVPTPTPTPTPTPNPAISIERVREASGAIITSAAGSSIVFIQGSGFGAGGLVKIAGQAVAVLNWLPYQLECKLPVVATTQTGPVVVSPTGINPGSGLSFTILATAPVPGPTPTPLPPPVPVPGKRVEFPLGSGWLWLEGRLPGWGPHGPTSQHVEKP